MLKLLVLLSVVLSVNSFADTKLGIMGTLLYNNAEIDAPAGMSGLDEKSGTSFGLGVRAIMGISDQLFFRSGAGFIQKKWSYEFSGVSGEVDASVTYLNIPATLYWKASPQVGFFGGTNIQAKLDDKFDVSGSLGTFSIEKSANTIVLPLVLGFDFSFTEQFGMEISYEYGIMETIDDTKVSSGIVSLIYNFPN